MDFHGYSMATLPMNAARSADPDSRLDDERDRVTCRKVLMLVSGCMVAACSGAALVASVYSEALTHAFKLSREQADLASSLCTLGFSCGFVPGSVRKFLGARVALLSGALFVTMAHILMYSACVDVHKEFYMEHPGMILFCQFLMGLGSSYGFFVPLETCARSFPDRHRGKIIGLIVASVCFGKLFFGTVYAEVFLQKPAGIGHTASPSGYFVIVSLAFVLASLLGVASLAQCPPVSDDKEQQRLLIEKPEATACPTEEQQAIVITGQKDADEMTGWTLLANKDFHIICWHFILSGTAITVMLENMTTYLHAMKPTAYSAMGDYLSPLTQIVYCITSGWVSDFFRLRCATPRSIWLFVGYVEQFLALLLCAVLGQSMDAFLIGVVIVAATNATLFTLVPTTMSEKFGVGSLAVNYGLLTFVISLALLVAEHNFGAARSQVIVNPAPNNCYLLQRFSWSVILTMVFSLVGCWHTGASFFYDQRPSPKDSSSPKPPSQ